MNKLRILRNKRRKVRSVEEYEAYEEYQVDRVDGEKLSLRSAGSGVYPLGSPGGARAAASSARLDARRQPGEPTG